MKIKINIGEDVNDIKQKIYIHSKKEIVYFICNQGKILGQMKNPKMIPRKGEIMIFKPDDKKYNVIEIVYTYEKNSYICWVYLNESI